MSFTESDSDRPRTHWKRYVLFASLAGAVLVAVCIGWQAKQVRVQQHAIAAIASLGGTVYYDYQCNADGARLPRVRRRSPTNPVAHLASDDWFNRAVNVQLPYLAGPDGRGAASNLPADVIKPISNLTGLKTARLSFSDVSNEDLHQLSQLKDLRSLALQATKVREGNLDGLRELNLEFLSLEMTQCDDEGLEGLQRMKTLEFLNLTHTNVSDAGLSHLHQLPALRTLILKRTLVTRSGYEAFKKQHPMCMVSWEKRPPRTASTRSVRIP